MSKRRCLMTTLSLRKIPPLYSMDKVWTDHYTYGVMEARAITVLRTGNLAFKNWCPWKFSKKNIGDLRCMFPACSGMDTLKHVLECEFYTTKFIEKDGPTMDWATYLVALNNERIDKFGQALISCEGWSTTKQ